MELQTKKWDSKLQTGSSGIPEENRAKQTGIPGSETEGTKLSRKYFSLNDERSIRMAV
jgi:hypothetical protein